MPGQEHEQHPPESTETYRPERDTHWTDQIASNPNCANCGTPRDGAFCVQCGQQHLDDRLKFGGLIKTLFSRLTDIDRGLYHTFICLCKRPGVVARDYASGKQKPYVNPLTYFFLAATLQVISFWSVMGYFRAQLQADLREQLQDAETNVRLEKLLGESLPDAMADSYATAVTQGYSYLALFFYAIPFAGLLWLLHKARGEVFRLGETVVFALYVFSQILVLTAALTPFALRFGTTVQMIMALAVYVTVPQLAHGGFFERSWTSRLATTLATMLAWFPFVLSILALFLIAFAGKVAWAMYF